MDVSVQAGSLLISSSHVDSSNIYNTSRIQMRCPGTLGFAFSSSGVHSLNQSRIPISSYSPSLSIDLFLLVVQ